MNRPVITGAAAVTPLGRNLSATREALDAGRTAILPVDGREGPAFSPAARIGPFTTEPELAKGKARRMDLGSQYVVVTARQCLADAGYEVAGREERTGILLATGSAGAGPLTEFERQMAVESPEAASPFLFPNTVSNAPASQVALELKLKGPNVTLIQKDPGPLNALFYARLMLADARADALLVGAVDEWNFLYHECYERLRVTRTSTRAGIALGEGAGLVLVETEDSAERRGARVLARASGLAMRTRPVSPHERRADPGVLAATMEAAIEDAGVTPRQIGRVHLSADGTPWMDAAEQEALARVFPELQPPAKPIKEQLGENPCVVAAQLALAAVELHAAPEIGAILLNAFGAGGNFVSAVLTTFR